MSQAHLGIRLSKFISNRGCYSRKQAIRLIESGRVTIDGVIPGLSPRVFPEQQVCIDQEPIAEPDQPVYLALNKPVGIECNTRPDITNNIIDFVGFPSRIFPIGRLDKDSQGLILLSNDGAIVNQVMHSRFDHEKEYIVTVDLPITPWFLSEMAKGVLVRGQITKPCVIHQTDHNQFSIILTQGLNRQIRRMCQFFGFSVLKLERIRVMHITLQNLAIGQWRYLTTDEVTLLIAHHDD